MPDTPLAELERLKADAYKAATADELTLEQCAAVLITPDGRGKDFKRAAALRLLAQAREAAENRVDAERYRYIREHGTPDAECVFLTGDSLDAAIDAARKGEI